MAKKVFVLEDDEGIRDIVQMVLEMEGYEVSLFADVAKFNARGNTDLPDLYLLDIMLPDGNGLQVRKELLEDTLTSRIPILVMSAHTDSGNGLDGTNFIAKPFDIYDFTAKVERLIS